MDAQETPISAENAPQPVDKPVPEADSASPAPKPPSPGQELLDRFLAQAKRIDALAARLKEVRVYIDAPKQAGGAGPLAEPAPPAKARPTSFFAGMGAIADFNDAAITRLDEQVRALEALF